MLKSKYAPALLVLVLACGQSEDAGKAKAAKPTEPTVDRSYALYYQSSKTEPAGGVSITASFPQSWKELEWHPGEAKVQWVEIALVKKDTAAEVVNTQFAEPEVKAGKREELPGGRIWLEVVKPDKRKHAVMAIPVAAVGVVRCFVTLSPDEWDRFPAARALCDSIRVGAK